MGSIRRTLGTLFAILGAFYGILSALTLLRLSTVTDRWIQLSGDPDFNYDRGMFMMWIGVGAVLVGALGFGTAAKGLAAARGDRNSWLGLAIGSLVLHWFWFLYRTIGTGLLDRGAQAIARRDNVIRFGGICAAYFVMWIITRQRQMADRPANIGLERTARN